MKEITPEEVVEFLENNANTLYHEILDMIQEYKEEYPPTDIHRTRRYKYG